MHDRWKGSQYFDRFTVNGSRKIPAASCLLALWKCARASSLPMLPRLSALTIVDGPSTAVLGCNKPRCLAIPKHKVVVTFDMLSCLSKWACRVVPSSGISRTSREWRQFAVLGDMRHFEIIIAWFHFPSMHFSAMMLQNTASASGHCCFNDESLFLVASLLTIPNFNSR